MMFEIAKCWTERQQNDPRREHDHRSPYQRDRGRILHSAAFRCLQAKKQIHSIGENDFYRTRLTHSLEVAQIGGSLTSQLKLEDAFIHLRQQKGNDYVEQIKPSLIKKLLPANSLIETLCLAHDIGHPPFGHGGEVALNYMMSDCGGFEGNGQSFRILTKLEPYTPQWGMNLTRRTLLGILKYPVILDQVSPQYQQLDLPRSEDPRYVKMENWRPGKGIFRDDLSVFNWVLSPLSSEDYELFTSLPQRISAEQTLKSLYKSLDCSIMELADDIAYAVHDFEDAIVVGLVHREQWQSTLQQLQQCRADWIRGNIVDLTDALFSDQHYLRKNAIGSLVNYFITHIRWRENEQFHEPLLRFNAELPLEIIEVLNLFKQFVSQFVIHEVKTQRIEYRGQRILTEMFQIFITDPVRLLPPNTVKRWQQAEETHRKRIICDYIAGMSDAYALRLYQQL
ncbi:anti-phage deoxyguanosine triphosphatase [Gallibacterium genomosp. 1]|uniref:Deoxyguanosinetriphosphate triphosphohydrolase-like protein n=1 Tax=Gallibacterium genomosp. 1 TaxID=155515 RepID=A0AB36DW52_9PAST|nr:anti-phage deoxyguanosine triphosphatase [Gallibacterium genomosp. 1]OBX00818.1 deoxyguanosinetriphosphate triphosphohydrolase [Gallibacterium genomosp. 1]OBX01194.1 deoxyguanosinetriphosphate triphosphohydrolase [Gallibacterium genomosp. 1]